MEYILYYLLRHVLLTVTISHTSSIDINLSSTSELFNSLFFTEQAIVQSAILMFLHLVQLYQ